MKILLSVNTDIFSLWSLKTTHTGQQSKYRGQHTENNKNACVCTKTEMATKHKQLALLIYAAVCSEKDMKFQNKATFG